MMQKNEIVKVKIERLSESEEKASVKWMDTRCLSKMPSSGML